MSKLKYFFSLTAIVLLSFPTLTFSVAPPQKASAEQLQALQRYIKQSWHTLKRSNAQLAQAAPDPKFKPMADGRCLHHLGLRLHRGSAGGERQDHRQGGGWSARGAG